MIWRNWLGGLRGSGKQPAVTSPRRWLVVDVETTGLDPRSDTLLAIGAVAVVDGRVVADDSIELTLRPANISSRSNILIHGIGESAQRDGLDPQLACQQFLDFAAGAPLIAFHAEFDRAFLGRAVLACSGSRMTSPWLDLAALAPVVEPQARARDLDEWLAHGAIDVDQRHRAIDDAFATAMLLLRTLHRVPPNERDWDSLTRLVAQARWLKR